MQMIHLVLMLGRLGGKSAFPDKEDSLAHNYGAGEDPLGDNISVFSQGLLVLQSK
jgi:hypothetical protein